MGRVKYKDRLNIDLKPKGGRYVYVQSDCSRISCVLCWLCDNEGYAA